MEIKHRYTGAVLFSMETNSTRVCVEAAIKSGADLYEANLYEANLYEANLYEANLYEADLRGANLRGANLRGADLRGADLSRANLSRADLSGADLSGSNLYGANLYGANLSGSNLYWADMSGANLYGANLYGAKNADLSMARTIIVPEGQIIGWKKLNNGAIAKLSIPADARRSNASGRKCRAEYADVLEIIGAESGKSTGSAPDGLALEYRPGIRVTADKWGEYRWQECSSGIHFYITRLEAENH